MQNLNPELGPPPKRLSAVEREIWWELAASLQPGITQPCDRLAFELLVKLTYEARCNPADPERANLLRTLREKFFLPPDEVAPS